MKRRSSPFKAEQAIWETHRARLYQLESLSLFFLALLLAVKHKFQ